MSYTTSMTNDCALNKAEYSVCQD